MTPRRLRILGAADRDIARRARYLAEIRGRDVAERFAVDLKLWLERLAEGGAQLGTALGADPEVRSFGYDGQATIIVRFTPGEFRVLRVFFKGQDWSRAPEGR